MQPPGLRPLTEPGSPCGPYSAAPNYSRTPLVATSAAAAAATAGVDLTWFSPGGLQHRAAENVEGIMAGRAPLPAVACGLAAGGAALELQMLSPESRHRRADVVVAATMEGRAAPPLGSGCAAGNDAIGGAATGGAASGSAAACGAAVLAVAPKKTKKRPAAVEATSQASASAAVAPSVLWKWRSDAEELQFLLDGAFPYRKDSLTTLLELYDAYYCGGPTECGARMPPWIDLFNKYGPKDDRNALANVEAGSWYPGGKVAKQLTQRMWEYRSLHRWCIVVTGEHRGRGLKEAADFWAGKTKQTLKPFWEDVIQYLVEEPALFAEVVAVNPPAAAWQQRLRDVGAAFIIEGNTAGGAAGAAAGGVGKAETSGTRAKNVLFMWLESKAAEPGPDMTLPERMQGWFAMTYAERTAWKVQCKSARC